MNKVFFGKANTTDVITRCSYIEKDKEWFNGVDVGDYIFIKVQGESTAEGAVVNYLFRGKSWHKVDEGYEFKFEQIACFDNKIPLKKFIALDIFCLDTNLLNSPVKTTKGCITPLTVIKDGEKVLQDKEKWDAYYASEPIRKICILDDIKKVDKTSNDLQLILKDNTVELYNSDFISPETVENFNKNAMLQIMPKKRSSKRKMFDILKTGSGTYSWRELSLVGFYDFFITKVETKRDDFIEYCKTHGVPTAYKQYESAIRTMESSLGVNADNEFENDGCKNMLDNSKALPEAKIQDFPSKLKKFIEYKKSLEEGVITDEDTLKTEAPKPSKESSVHNISINTILYGPPGTGKTYNTVLYAVAICDPGTSLDDLKEKAKTKEGYDEIYTQYEKLMDEGRITFTTFHQSYGYEDFIEGIKPKILHDNVTYSVDSGVFKQFCESGSDSKQNKVFIIDEINRGNVSKIFGELITLIEEEKRGKSKVVLPYSVKEFTVPENVYILGTMNTADRSLALMDTALRRRFDFVEMLPNEDLFEKIVIDGISLKDLLKRINERIEFLYDREHTIGHAYFKDLLIEENRNIETLRRIFEKKIIPLLQEYFYDDYNRIRLILGDNQMQENKECFIKKDEMPKNLFGDNPDFDMPSEIYTVNSNIKNFEAERFIKIYDNKPTE